MAFLHTQSCECLKSELLLFDIPPTLTAIESSKYVQYKPISSLTDESPIEFTITGTGDEYIDLAHTMLSLKVSLKGEIPKDIKEEAVQQIGPVNNFMHSLFNQVDVFFNQKAVSPPNHAYAYRAYIETLLNYGPAAKKSHLTSVLW